MKSLTEAKAIDLTIELWAWLAETGKEKEDWPSWEGYGGLDEKGDCKEVESLCFLCKFADRTCSSCPYYKKFDLCYNMNAPFSKWEGATTSKTRKKYAKMFLEQMNQLKQSQ